MLDIPLQHRKALWVGLKGNNSTLVAHDPCCDERVVAIVGPNINENVALPKLTPKQLRFEWFPRAKLDQMVR